MIGIEDNKPEAIAALEPHVEDTGISVVSFPTKYPSGGEKQLIYILTGKEIPSGDLPADIGMVCVNIGTTYAVKRAIVDGEPLISRVTTMTGDACGINRNYETLIGTPVSHMLANSEFNEETCSRLVMGGPMMGFSLTSSDVPIVKTTNCILAPSYDEIPDDEPAQPCIRCGMCAEACPVSLLPQQLFWYSQADDHERLEAHNLFDCIECGACSYVCPSNIPLVQHYRHSKGEIQKARAEKVKSDHARERFEFHQQRIEQAEREQRSQAHSATGSRRTSQSQGCRNHLQAICFYRRGSRRRYYCRSPGPCRCQKGQPGSSSRRKFERSIAGAEMRLQMAEEKLAEADEGHSDEQKNILSAAVEGADKNLSRPRATGRAYQRTKASR